MTASAAHSVDGITVKWMIVMAGAVCCAIGAVTMIAWNFHFLPLLLMTSASTPMRFNTGLAFLLSGMALIASAHGYKKVALGCSGIVGALALATAMEFLLGRSFGIDDLLFDDYRVGAATLDPRMAPNTAVALVASSASLLLLPRRRQGGWAGLSSVLLGSVTFVLGMVAAIGYAASLEVAYSWGKLTGMSLVAAVGLLTLGTGMLAAAWQEAQKTAAIPAWAPVPLVVVFAATSVLLWRALLRTGGERESAIAGIVLGAGLGMAALTAISMRLAQVTSGKHQEVRSLNRSLRAIGRCNELILHSCDEQEILNGVCRVLVEECGHALAWVGYPQHDESKSVKAVAAAGITAYVPSVTWADDPNGRGPTGTALRTGEICGSDDLLQDPQFAPWMHDATQHGLRSSVVIPLRAPETFGCISIYSPHPHGFSAEETKLLAELAGNVSFGISALRTRAEGERAEQQRRASEERYRSLVLATAQIIWTTDPDGLVNCDMPTWRGFTGTTFDQLLGSGWLQSVHPEDRERTAKLWRDAVQARSLYETEYRLRRRDGEYRHMWVRGVPVMEADGHTIREWVGACTDISGRKQAEESLKHYAAELERSNGELQDFASIASHDLQEPLRKVLAFGEHLREHCQDKLDELGLDFLSRMQSAARRMSLLIEALLAYSRVATKAQTMQVVDMMSTLFGVLVDLEERIGKTHARIEFGSMPRVMADPMQMRQVLQNLIGNALKFQKPGVTPHVVIAGRRLNERFCELTVRDNGIGFDEKYLDRIFRPFQRLHGHNEYEGSGMGLAICRKVIARHGGEITAHSQPGAGSTIVVTLPCVAEATATASEERTEPWTAETMVV